MAERAQVLLFLFLPALDGRSRHLLVRYVAVQGSQAAAADRMACRLAAIFSFSFALFSSIFH